MAQQPGVADLLVRCPEREGVTAVPGVPGDEGVRFVGAPARSPIRNVQVHYEQAESFMTEIYGRLTGRAGVCSVTLGPGMVGLNLIYRESRQGAGLMSMFSPVTERADGILTPGAVP